MRDQARERISHLYSKAAVTVKAQADQKPYAGRELTVIAWLWVHTVASSAPMMRGVHMLLVSSFVLSSRKRREAIVVPAAENGDYRFAVKTGGIGPEALARARSGTKALHGANIVCLLSGAPLKATTSRPRAWPGA